MEGLSVSMLRERIPSVEESSSEEECFHRLNPLNVKVTPNITVKKRLLELESYGRRVCSNLKVLDAKRCKLLEEVEQLYEAVEGTHQRRDSISDYTQEGEFCDRCRFDRCRGGVDHPEGEDCQEKGSCANCPPEASECSFLCCCYKADTDSSSRVDTSGDVLEEVRSDRTIPPQIEKVHRVGRLRENLEQLKNRNHSLRKLLRQCSCPMQDLRTASSTNQIFKERNDCFCGNSQCTLKESKADLIVTIRLLQSKCRTKDRIIFTLVNELRNGVTLQQTDRILENLGRPDLAGRADDFDRSTLCRYLTNVSPPTRPVYKRILDSDQRRNVYIVFLISLLILLVTLLHFYGYIHFKVCPHNILASVQSQVCGGIVTRVVGLFSISYSNYISEYTCTMFKFFLSNQTGC